MSKSPYEQSSFFDNKPEFLSIKKWQKVVDELTTLFGASGAWIMQANTKGLEAVAANSSMIADAPAGTKFDRDINIYCKTVVETNKLLYVKNAATDIYWEDNPEFTKSGLCSYLGLPIQWPGGAIFGTLCVLDNKETNYSEKFVDLLSQLKDIVESDLKNATLTDRSPCSVDINEKQDVKTLDIVNYTGAMTQSAIATCMSNIEESISDIFMMGKVSIIAVELCQNMMHYSKTKEEQCFLIESYGLIRVVNNGNHSYYLESSNIINAQDKERIQATLSEIEELDKAGIKKRYRELRKSGKNTHAKGGGIGYYEIAKISNLFSYTYSKINNDKYYFNFNINVAGKNQPVNC